MEPEPLPQSSLAPPAWRTPPRPGPWSSPHQQPRRPPSSRWRARWLG
eukprot:CAMPEP_0196680168 /NCGR_PEP_ID=MMETSP1090-20130531/7612_1 /TAXON_ID=37098 /ORGANISM="Isochrysis sp, Strain CCMP1244" /LENGTH=46 /DNA_ID= /DNA_START= /DNA_END= /DNA_ORIENTATION=